MRYVEPPHYKVDQAERTHEGQRVFADALDKLIKQAVSEGWREKEAALHLADAAEDYVIYLAAGPRERVAANRNMPS